MKVHFIRHGQTDWNLKQLIQGKTDIPLNETGISQAKEAKTKIDELDIDICFSSPLSRALITAEIICGGKHKIITDDRLIERNYGDIEGKPLHEPLSELWDLKSGHTDYNAESIEDLLARAKDFVDFLKSQPYNDVLVVCHGALLKAIYFNIVGYDENTDFFSWHLTNCEVYTIEI